MTDENKPCPLAPPAQSAEPSAGGAPRPPVTPEWLRGARAEPAAPSGRTAALVAALKATSRRFEDMSPQEQARSEATMASIRARMTPRPLQPGEELRHFSSDATAWENLAGRAGYEILRDGVVVERVVTIRN